MILSESAAARRMRLYRKRRSGGARCVRVSLHVTEIDGLIRKGYLPDNDRDDPSAVQWGIEALINDALSD
jgi:hypothetical protein